MKCERVLELLSEYIDGELSSAAVLGVQSHLKRCESCEAEHQALRRTVQLVALFGRQQAPIDVRDAVMARLREVPAPAPRRSWPSRAGLFSLPAPAVPSWARATALAGLAILAIGTGSVLLSRQQEHVEPVAYAPAARMAREDQARMRESSQLLQALGREDAYILAAEIVDDNP